MESHIVAYTHYDVIVVGAGHAGCEAAAASARIGARTMLMTMDLDAIAQMPCNPAIGGIGKGQVVCEIDALGGEMGINTDAARIQFRMLNRSKGPAVWSPRAQCDKLIYQRRMKHVLERYENLFIHQAEAVRLTHVKDRVTGVETCFGDVFEAKAVVICAGTFLRGKLHYGMKQYSGGRAGANASVEMSKCLLNEMGLESERLKTGTPPRIVAHTIDFDEMTVQESETDGGFSHWPDAMDEFKSIAPRNMPQKACYATHTTKETKKLVLDNVDRSPMFNGAIEGVPTRYCPSFEDKIVRFKEHDEHHVYVEPEGSFTEEYYLNGISTSLPIDVQWKMIRSLPGFKRAELSRYAYAIEYDVIMPRQLNRSMALRRYPNLFLAGQINGTTGYEEAAGQGLVAGANAAITAANDNGKLFVPARDQAYIGVMIDDLVSKDIVEPYRLFTSRAEYRLSLRQDNATRRLSKMAYECGLLSAKRYEIVKKETNAINEAVEFLRSVKSQGVSLWDKLRKRQIDCSKITELDKCSAYVKGQLEIEARYEGYVKMEKARVQKLQKLDSWKIPADFDYESVKGMRIEARQKLIRLQPETLAQAARLDGVTPAEIGLMQVYIKRG